MQHPKIRSGRSHCYVPHVPCLKRNATTRTSHQGHTLRATQQTTSIVLGSGISGLAAAKVLSKYCRSVKVVDKDAVRSLSADSTAPDVSQSKGARRGVAQYNHLHILAGKGLLTLDDLFEGRFIPALEQSGAVLSDVVTRFTNYHPAGGRWALPAAAAKGPVLMGQATRHVVESVTRQLLQQSVPEGVVEVLDSTAVTGLLLEQGDGGEAQPRIAGVQLANGEQLHADLVVDCSGRQSKMPQWLAAAGLPTPRVSQVDANLGYASWLVRLDPEVAARTLQCSSGVYAIAAYPQAVGAACVQVEGGLHMVGLCTYAGQAPPFKDEQLLDFMHQHAWHPAVLEVVAGATAVTRASRFYRVASTWRHYEEVAAALPEGLLVMADAVCSFNPIYGHGMTVAALEVAKLDELLAAHQSAAAAAASNGSEHSWLAGLSGEYQQAITPIIQRVWELSVGGDLRFGSTTSTEPASAASSVMNAYFDTLMVLAASDPEVSETLLRVMHLIDESSELLTPRMLGKVLRHHLNAPLAKLRAGLAPGGSGSGGSTGARGATGEAGA